jgi:hypothetical protein
VGSNPATPTTRSTGETRRSWNVTRRSWNVGSLNAGSGVALVIVKAGFDNPSVFNKRLRKGAGLARRQEYTQSPTPEVEPPVRGQLRKSDEVTHGVPPAKRQGNAAAVRVHRIQNHRCA